MNLILCEGKTLTATKGISVLEGNSLTIYGQSGGTVNLILCDSATLTAGKESLGTAWTKRRQNGL